MKNTRERIFFLGIYAAAIIGIYLIKPGGQHYAVITASLTYITALIALFFGFESIRYFGIRTTQGKSNLFIVLALLSWLLGDFFWDLSGDAVVSIGDLFFFGFYPLLGVAIILGIRTISQDYFANKKRLLLLGATWLLLSVFYFHFFPLSWDSQIGTLQNITTHGYNIADFLALCLIALLIGVAATGRFSVAWIIYALALVFFWIGDIRYALTYDSYQSGDLTDLFWLLGNIIFACGLIVSSFAAQKSLEKMRRDFSDSRMKYPAQKQLAVPTPMAKKNRRNRIRKKRD